MASYHKFVMFCPQSFQIAFGMPTIGPPENSVQIDSMTSRPAEQSGCPKNVSEIIRNHLDISTSRHLEIIRDLIQEIHQRLADAMGAEELQALRAALVGELLEAAAVAHKFDEVGSGEVAICWIHVGYTWGDMLQRKCFQTLKGSHTGVYSQTELPPSWQ